MRIGWWVAAAALVLAGCGDDERAKARPEETTGAPSAAGPTPDPGTRTAAAKVLDAALDRFIADATGHHRTEIRMGDGTMVAEGRWDIARELGSWTLSQSALGREGAVDGRFTFKSVAVGRHLYAGPDFGPARQCWFDYGTEGIEDVMAEVGVSAQADPRPWFHPSMEIASESRALGFVEGDEGTLAVEIYADSALSVMFAKMLRSSSATLPEEQVWVPAVLRLKDGDYSSMTFSVGDALSAMEEAGLEVTSDGTSDEDMADYLDILREVVMTTFYDELGEPVDIAAPAPETLIDTDDVVAAERAGESGALCAAAQD